MKDLLLLELESLFREGGAVLVALIFLAFAIAWALLRIFAALAKPRKFLRNQSNGSWDHEALDKEFFAPLDRRLCFAFVLVSAAPLLGLLGTVTGMLTTFTGLSGSATKAPVDVISRGVSEALITTQAGLIIGVPSFIVCSILKSHFGQLRLEFEGISLRQATT